MHLIRWIVAMGLGTMAAVALATAIWPAVAVLVTGVLVIVLCAVLCAGCAALAVQGVRLVRAEQAWRRELRGMAPVTASPYADAVGGPTLAQLRESA